MKNFYYELMGENYFFDGNMKIKMTVEIVYPILNFGDN